MAATERTDDRPALVGTVVLYRGRRYTIAEEPDLVEKAGVAEVVNSRGDSNWLFIAVDDAGQIIRAATRHEPWADVTTTPPD